MKLGLDERVILIVGASAGIGAATARLLVAEGARVSMVARRTAELEALAEELRRAGGAVLTFTGDAGEPGFLDRVVMETSGRFGALNGLAVVAAPMGASPRIWQKVMAGRDCGSTASHRASSRKASPTALCSRKDMVSRRSARAMSMSTVNSA